MSFSPRNELVDTLITGRVIGYQPEIHGPSVTLIHGQWHTNTSCHKNHLLNADGRFSFNVRINVIQNCGVGVGSIGQFALRPGIPVYLELTFTSEEEGFDFTAPDDAFTQMSIDLIGTLITGSDMNDLRDQLSKVKNPVQIHSVYDAISDRSLTRLPGFAAKYAPFPQELQRFAELYTSYSIRRDVLFSCLQFMGEDKSLQTLSKACKYVFRQDLPEQHVYHMSMTDIIQNDSMIMGRGKFFGQAMPSAPAEIMTCLEEMFQRIRQHYNGFAHDIAYCQLLFWALGRREDNLPGLIERVNSFLQLTPYPALREPLAHLYAVVKGEIAPANDYPQQLRRLPEGIDNPIPAILEQHRGKVIVLDFWSTFCGPCVYELKQEYPLIIPQYAPQKVAFVFFCRQSSEAAWRECISTLQFSAEHYLTNREQTAVLNQLFGITGIPHHVIFDQTGKMVKGEIDGPGRGLTTVLDTLLHQE